MKKFLAGLLVAAGLCAFGAEDGWEFSLDRRLDEEIAKSAEKNFEGSLPGREPLFYSASSKSAFIVFSKNLQARNFGFSLLGMAERAIEEMFGEVASFQNPIEVHFIGEKDAKFEGWFLETSRFGSDAVLSVKFSENLPVGEFFEKIAAIYLRAYAFKLGGAAAAKNPPFWLELALRSMIARQVADFAPIELARTLEKSKPDSVLDVLKYSRGGGGDVLKKEASAYFTLLAMRSACGGTPDAWFAMVKKFAAAPDAGEDMLKSCFGDNWRDRLFVAVYGEIYARLSGVKDCRASDADAAYLFTIMKVRKSAPAEIIAGSDIFERREELKNEISTRVAEIKLELPWSNPVYFNVFVSIGRMYDAALDGDREDFEKNLAEALFEFQKARRVSERLRGLLD
ncbi:MAG: hypothetical protein IKS15_05070 [Opitutales bacterium]|nr:hypothetical protein [Opitutales bacterium]